MCELLGPSKFTRPFDVYDVYRSTQAVLILGYRKRDPERCSLLEVNIDTDQRGVRLVGGEELLDRRKALDIVESGSHDAHSRLLRSRIAQPPRAGGVGSSSVTTTSSDTGAWSVSSTRASSQPPNGLLSSQQGQDGGATNLSGSSSASSSTNDARRPLSRPKPKPIHSKMCVRVVNHVHTKKVQTPNGAPNQHEWGGLVWTCTFLCMYIIYYT